MEELKVTAVERTMLILETIAKNNQITLSDISKKTDLHKSTVFRFLNTLESLGYIIKTPKDEGYYLSTKMNNFHVASNIDNILLDEGIRIVDAIAKHTKETVHLAKLEDDKLTYLYKVESTQTLRVSTSSQIAGEAPLYCTGLGKAMLAYLKKDDLIKIIDKLDFIKFTDTTITDKESLNEELIKIKEKGYSIDNGEHEIGIMCISKPILLKELPIAAISISGPAERMNNNIQKYYLLLETLIDDFQDKIQSIPFI